MNQSNLLTVRVAGVMNRQAVVLHAGRTLPCLLSGRLLRQKDSLAVGDRAEAEVLGGGQYRLTRVLPRTSALRRPSRRGSGDALLAANADFVLAVCAAPALRGKAVAVLGGPGCGKTALIQRLAGVQAPLRPTTAASLSQGPDGTLWLDTVSYTHLTLPTT